MMIDASSQSLNNKLNEGSKASIGEFFKIQDKFVSEQMSLNNKIQFQIEMKVSEKIQSHFSGQGLLGSQSESTQNMT